MSALRPSQHPIGGPLALSREITCSQEIMNNTNHGERSIQLQLIS